jgi:hypothetical protein
MLIFAERMLDQSNEFCLEGVQARTTSSFTYTRWDGGDVTIEVGTSILVDVIKGVATTRDDNPDHFEIEASEYEIDPSN